MTEQQIIDKLRDDEHYYGKFGKKYFSYSNIGTLIKTPLTFHDTIENNVNFVLGGYFHTSILEPNKLEKFKIIKTSSRNTNVYKEQSNGDICVLEKEAEMLQVLKEKLLENDHLNSLIIGDNIEYEVPNIGKIENRWFKCKADVLNHNEKMIIDLKTTSKEIDDFKWSAKDFYYNSQAYIYSKLFDYEFVFVVVKKPTLKQMQEAENMNDLKKSIDIGYFDCSDLFLSDGLDNIRTALENYKLYYETPGFKAKNFFYNETL